jgi:hypothetical protein
MIEFTGAVLAILAGLFGIAGFVGLMACTVISNGFTSPLFGQSAWMMALGVVLVLPLFVF